MDPLAEAEKPGRGEGYWGNVQKVQESGGECPVELRSWVGLQLMDGLREADHLPAKRWSDYSVVWGAEGGVEQGEGACLERPVKMLLQQS